MAASAKRDSIEQSNPTDVAYGSLTRAFAFFNEALFGGKLPECIVTFQRHPKSLAYFSGDRFTPAHESSGVRHDEIAMNPLHMAERTPETILSTLVHEMCHSWQHHHGKPPTRCYHDKEWATKMKEVGLQPSHTAKEGGKETGPQMSHYIIQGGPFQFACAKYMETNKPAFYQDLALVQRAARAARKKGKDPAAGGDGEGDEPEVPKSKGRAKFTCPGCKLNAWAKPSALLMCMGCERPLVEEAE